MLAAADNWVLVVSFAIYTVAIVLVGLYSARYAKRSDEDYFLAGRSLGRWVAALSASASSESGWVTLGLVGTAFSSGVKAYWILPGCLLGFIFNWFILAGPMRQRAGDLGALTLPDFFALHFREKRPILRLLSVLVILTAMLLYVASQLAAAGKAFMSAMPGVDYQAGVLIGAAIVLVYTVSGGFRAVCWTDFLQAFLMLGALVVFPVYLLATQMGFGDVLTRLEGIKPSLVEFMPGFDGESIFLASMGFLLGNLALGINFGYPGQPHVLVRFMALRDRKEARLAGVIAVAWGALVYWGAVTTGLIARAMVDDGASWGAGLLASDADAERCLVLAAANLLPQILAGVVLAAVLAAICSTADSQLVVAASAAANDVYARLLSRKKEGAHLLVNRLVVFGLGIGAVLLVIDEQVKVYEYVLNYGWAILGAAFGPQVILLLFWRRASYAGCVAGMFVGAGVALVWKLMTNNVLPGFPDVQVYNLPLAFACATLVNVVVSLVTPLQPGEVGAASAPRTS